MRIELGQISIYFRIHHTFLVISEKVKETFLSTTSQSLKDGSLTTYEVWRKHEGALYSIYKFCLKASLSEDWGGLFGYLLSKTLGLYKWEKKAWQTKGFDMLTFAYLSLP